MVKGRRQLLVPVIFALIVISPSYVVSLRNDIFGSLNNHSLGNDDFDLLIIAPQKFQSELERLILHKENIGINTTLITTEDINQSFHGKDKAEKVKYCIKYYLEKSNIRYVLLVGGLKGFRCNPENEASWLVPARYSHLDLDGYPESKYLCDLYFADIYDESGEFCSWDTDNDGNGDGIFGEWKWEGGMYEEKDERDLIPDVALGRLPCRNRLEVRIMVNKIIDYESRDVSNESWFNRMILVGGDSYDDSKGTFKGLIEGRYANEMALKWARNRYNFTYIGLWPLENVTTKGNLKVENFILKQSIGSGLTFLSGHGDWGTWYNRPIHGDFNEWENIRRLHLPMLWNGKRTPVMVVGGCHTAGFDTTISSGGVYFTIECFSWVLTRKIGGGSVATLGNTALEYGVGGTDFIEGYGGYLEARFFEIYGNETPVIGEIWQREITNYVNITRFNVRDDMVHCKAVENWVLLGDPSLRIGGYP